MVAIFKQEAHKLVDELPESAGWDELVYQAAVHRAIERGLVEADAGQLIAAEDLLAEFEAVE